MTEACKNTDKIEALRSNKPKESKIVNFTQTLRRSSENLGLKNMEKKELVNNHNKQHIASF